MANIQKRKNNIQRNFFLHKETQRIFVIDYKKDGTIIGSCTTNEPLKDLNRYKCNPDNNISIQNNIDKFELFTDLDKTTKLELMRQGHKFRVELYKYKNKVKSDVWIEIEKEIKRLRSGISLVPGAYYLNGKLIKKEDAPEIFTPDYEGYAENFIKKAQETVANRKKYADYAKMNSSELKRAFVSNRNLRSEFNSVFPQFGRFIIETFPDSPIQYFTEFENLRNITDEHIDRMIRDTPQKETEKAGQGKAKSSVNKKKDIKKRFSFYKTQASFDKKDLGLPTGAEINPAEILKKLVKSFGKVVPYKELDENSGNIASDFLRGKIRVIRRALEKHKVPCKILPKKWAGYILNSSRSHS